MREIKFRAIDGHSNEWVYGLPASDTETIDYSEIPSLFVGATEDEDCYLSEIIPGTLGQYTGLKDKNGKEIYEGDVHGIGDCTFEVRHGSYTDDMTLEESYGWHLYDERDGTGCNLGESETWVNIIGNIHENPELLERR